MAHSKTKSSRSTVRVALGPAAFIETLIREPNDSNLFLVVQTENGQQLSGRDFNSLLREARKCLDIYEFKINFGFLTSVYQNLVTKRRVIFVDNDGFDGQVFANKLNEALCLAIEDQVVIKKAKINDLDQLYSILARYNLPENVSIYYGVPED